MNCMTSPFCAREPRIQKNSWADQHSHSSSALRRPGKGFWGSFRVSRVLPFLHFLMSPLSLKMEWECFLGDQAIYTVLMSILWSPFSVLCIFLFRTPLKVLSSLWSTGCLHSLSLSLSSQKLFDVSSVVWDRWSIIFLPPLLKQQVGYFVYYSKNSWIE